jgi:hypothetical protein
MYADTITESMKAAIDETNRRRTVQEEWNRERGIEPKTIIKGIHDLNQRLRAVAESTAMYTSEREGRDLSELGRREVEQLVARLEAEMRSAAKELEFERAAALRDEIQQIRFRVLQEDEATKVARAAEAAAAAVGGQRVGAALPSRANGGRRRGGRAGRGAPGSGDGDVSAPAVEVTSVTVLPADEEPADTLNGMPGDGSEEGTASDWLPGIRDEHDDDGGWQARWTERQTWDRTVTPNVIRRTGARPPRRGGRRSRGY